MIYNGNSIIAQMNAEFSTSLNEASASQVCNVAAYAVPGRGMAPKDVPPLLGPVSTGHQDWMPGLSNGVDSNSKLDGAGELWSGNAPRSGLAEINVQTTTPKLAREKMRQKKPVVLEKLSDMPAGYKFFDYLAQHQ
jgi:hypothetical protein